MMPKRRRLQGERRHGESRQRRAGVATAPSGDRPFVRMTCVSSWTSSGRPMVRARGSRDAHRHLEFKERDMAVSKDTHRAS
jgi:hypothetical protein